MRRRDYFLSLGIVIGVALRAPALGQGFTDGAFLSGHAAIGGGFVPGGVPSLGPADPLVATRDQGSTLDFGLGVHLRNGPFAIVGIGTVFQGTLQSERFRERYAEDGFADFETGTYPEDASRTFTYIGFGYDIRLGALSLAPALSVGHVSYELPSTTLFTKSAGSNASTRLAFSPVDERPGEWTLGAGLELRAPLRPRVQTYLDAAVTRVTVPVRYRLEITDLLAGASSETVFSYPAPGFPVTVRLGFRVLLWGSGRFGRDPRSGPTTGERESGTSHRRGGRGARGGR